MESILSHHEEIGLPWLGTKRDHIWYGDDLPLGERRAGHALRDTQQIFTVITGSVQVHLEYGGDEVELRLTRGECLTMWPLIWHEVWTDEPGTILLVHSDQSYDRSKYYIEDKKVWLEKVLEIIGDE